MTAFGGLVLTNKGRNLQAKAQTGVALAFTRYAIGDGLLNGSSISELNTLKNERLSLEINKLKVLPGGQAIVGTILSNQTVTSGFYFREIGLFAQDPQLGEILYCYGNAGNNGEYIPAGSAGSPDLIEKTIDLIALTGNASNVSAVINNSLVFETPEGAQQKADSAESTAKAHADQIFITLDEEVTSHKADGVSHITAQERTDWNAKETPDGARKKVEQTNFKVYKSGKDSNGIFTTVEYKRQDDTLAIKSVLSGGTSPNYTTRTITYYGLNGTTVEKTTIRTLTYDADGVLISEV